ncbi:MAG TPA: MFS transporter [Casimicrobiaceae bacterium]|nr:MFS transporter [Casimicrobiaceae bacterium]
MNAPQQGAFRLLLTAIGVSAVGSRVTRTALPMAAILLLGATPLQLGWLSVLGVLPGALVAWWAGAWIDRRSRRAVLIGADWVRALLIATIPVTALLGTLTLIQLGVVAALVCMAGVLFEIADHAYLPVIVPSGHLVAANSKRETVDALAEITGPPLGGALVQWLTAPFALAIDACSFVVSALLIGRIRAREPFHDRPDSGQQAAGASLLREAREGAALVWRHPLLRPLFLSTTLLTFFMSFMASLYTLFALQTLHLSPGVLGLVIGCGGIGALAGAAATPALVRWIGPGRARACRIARGRVSAGVHSTRAGGPVRGRGVPDREPVFRRWFVDDLPDHRNQPPSAGRCGGSAGPCRGSVEDGCQHHCADRHDAGRAAGRVCRHTCRDGGAGRWGYRRRRSARCRTARAGNAAASALRRRM